MEMKKSRCCVYGLEYHIVLCTKYRKKVIQPKVEQRLHELLREFAINNDIEIMKMNGEEDHIHLLIAATPNTIIPNILKGMKGITAKMLMREFPEIKNQLYRGHFWSPSYFISTVSENLESNIIKYIESQKNK